MGDLWWRKADFAPARLSEHTLCLQAPVSKGIVLGYMVILQLAGLVARLCIRYKGRAVPSR